MSAVIQKITNSLQHARPAVGLEGSCDSRMAENYIYPQPQNSNSVWSVWRHLHEGSLWSTSGDYMLHGVWSMKSNEYHLIFSVVWWANWRPPWVGKARFTLDYPRWIELVMLAARIDAIAIGPVVCTTTSYCCSTAKTITLTTVWGKILIVGVQISLGNTERLLHYKSVIKHF